MLSSSFSQECLTLWFLCTQTPVMLVTSGSCLRLAACLSLLCWVGVVWFSPCDSMTAMKENVCMLSAKSKRQHSHGPFGQAWRDSSWSCLLCVTWVLTDSWLQNRNGGILYGGIPPELYQGLIQEELLRKERFLHLARLDFMSVKQKRNYAHNKT